MNELGTFALLIGVGAYLKRSGPTGETDAPPVSLPPLVTADPGDYQAYKNGQPVSVTLVAVDDKGHLLEASAAADFARMREAAALDNVSLLINSAFRTMREQQYLYGLYQQGKGNLAAPPGYSNHQDGLAADIETEGGTNDAFHWLTDNAERFNFYRTVSSEPWHWEHRA